MRLAAFMMVALGIVGCSDITLPAPEAIRTRTRALAAQAQTCPATATTVVSDEASLQAAVASAAPGDVIAVQGTIPLMLGVMITTTDITVTCATPGSGLTFSPTAEDFTLVYVLADRVTVRGLTLDAAGRDLAVYSENTDGQRTEYNAIICGDSCGLWAGTTNAVVSDNVVTQPALGSSGLHFQGIEENGVVIRGMSGTRVERNVIEALVPTGAPSFGGLRPRDGSEVSVANNTVRGPWSNSVSSVNMNNSSFERNELEGAQEYGMAMNRAGSLFVAMSRDNVVTANRIANAGIAGFLVRNACDNKFLGNLASATPHVFILAATSGANLVAGNATPSIDLGDFDCDGDGVNDPNTVPGNATGPSAAAAASTASRVDRTAVGSSGSRRTVELR